MHMFRLVGLAGALALFAQPGLAYGEESVEVKNLSAVQMFEIAANAEAAGETETVEGIYRALTNDPDPEIRAEARFRHGRFLAGQGKFAEAAVLFRSILDEKPDAQRVRLELAAVLARMGDMRGAGRAMRQAQAGGLPPDVAQLVSQFQGALRSLKPYGGSLEIALAPSTNINRATNSTTLDTIIAPFELSNDARAKSGVGAKLSGQAYLHLPVSKEARIVTRISGLSNLYRENRFSDIVGSVETGLEAVADRSVVRVLGGRSYRWFGGDLYATTNSVTMSLQRPLGKRSQIEVEGGIGRANYRANNLQDGRLFDASLSLERAFSTKMGTRLTLSGQRQTARDPGYATASGGISGLLYTEAGKATLYTTASLHRLEADRRLFLFPERRTEWLTRVGAGATLRQFKVAGFAPVVRFNWERNESTVGLYDYRRFTVEMGITRAF